MPVPPKQGAGSQYAAKEISMETKIREVIENQIRPLLQRDGGDIEFVSLDNKTVKVRLRGACAGCPASQMTLQLGVERLLREEVPDVERVVAVA
jgi:Fe-S cluster biogenesis protein NfuA